MILCAFFRDKISLQGCFLIPHRNFSPIKMHRFLIFYIKTMQILKKIQLYDIMFKKSNRLGISMDDLSDIVEKKEICNEKR